MNFQWLDLLAWADEWSSRPTIERYPQVHYRAVISRAYYAVYHSAEELARTLGLPSTASASDHFRVRKFFENRGRVAQQLSIALNRLYRWRISADYVIDPQDDVTIDAKTVAQQALAVAHRAMAMIENLQRKVV
jgi:uncharacterized protein (UPF0332 family)